MIMADPGFPSLSERVGWSGRGGCSDSIFSQTFSKTPVKIMAHKELIAKNDSIFRHEDLYGNLLINGAHHASKSGTTLAINDFPSAVCLKRTLTFLKVNNLDVIRLGVNDRN